MRNLIPNLRASRTVVALFALMVLLPAAVFTLLMIRAVRSEQARIEYDRAQRQRQLSRLIETDLTNWLFSAAPDAAHALALLRFEPRGERILFPAFGLSLSANELPQQRPFESGPPALPPTAASVTEQYFPRIQAFRRDLAARRNAGAQYFPRLRALVVQAPGSAGGYVIDVGHVLAQMNRRLAAFTATEPFVGRVWIASERTSARPADGFSLEGFPFFEVVFEDAPRAGLSALRDWAFPYSMSLLIVVTVLGSVFMYRAVSHEAQLARLRNDFVAAVSHEFRSPLASILALAERIERIDDPDRRREYHRIIRQDARRLGALVTRLLDFAMIEDGKMVYSFERTDLVETTRTAIDACHHAGGPGRIRLVGDEAAPLWVHADRTALQHAIQNVVENAAKYSPPEAPIVVQCSTLNGSHVVEVRDQGIGIPADEQTRIFEKFYRGRSVSGMNIQGVGIGLALVRHVVEGHGGCVVVTSQPGAGSRFALRVPSLKS